MVLVNPSGQTITQHDLLVGAANNNITSVSPSSTSGVPVISQGASADPAFGTAVVAGGGTGAVTLTGVLTGNGTSAITANAVTQHGVLIGGATNAVSSLGVATTGTFLGGNTGADPSFQSLPASSISITGDSGGALTGNAFTFTGGTTGLTFAGAGTTETLGGDLVVANGGTGVASFNINGPVISNTTTTGSLAAVTLASQKFLVGNSGAPTAKGFSVVNQVFINTGTYTPTSGMVYCQIECWGGGGAGGGANAGTGSYGGGGGGGAGGYSRLAASAATIGGSQAVTIGAAGIVGSAGNNPGGNGGDTSVGSLCIGKGGSGGGGAAGGGGTGGAGGVAGKGDITGTGAPGDAGVGAAVSTVTTGFGGAGGSSLVGGGGVATLTATGNAGTGNGSGGAGGNVINGNVTGGAGTKGYVVVTEYVIS